MDQLSSIFRALADKNRLRILNLLCHSSLCVGDMQKVLGLPQPFISRHLAYLRRVKLVKTEREGPRVCYSLARANLFSYPLQSLLREVLPFSLPAQADLQKLAECEESGKLRGGTFVGDIDTSGGATKVFARGSLKSPGLARPAESEGPAETSS